MEQNIRENKELWDLFTKREEYSHGGDKYGRFSFKQSCNKNPFYPEVSQFLHDKNLIVEYPDNKKFAICLTHDVDDIYPTTTQLLKSLIYEVKKKIFQILEIHFLPIH